MVATSSRSCLLLQTMRGLSSTLILLGKMVKFLLGPARRLPVGSTSTPSFVAAARPRLILRTGPGSTISAGTENPKVENMRECGPQSSESYLAAGLIVHTVMLPDARL